MADRVDKVRILGVSGTPLNRESTVWVDIAMFWGNLQNPKYI